MGRLQEGQAACLSTGYDLCVFPAAGGAGESGDTRFLCRCRGGDHATVPGVLCGLILGAAGTSLPVGILVTGGHIKGMGMIGVQLSNGFCLFFAALCAGKGLNTLAVLRGSHGHNTIIPAVDMLCGNGLRLRRLADLAGILHFALCASGGFLHHSASIPLMLGIAALFSAVTGTPVMGAVRGIFLGKAVGMCRCRLLAAG